MTDPINTYGRPLGGLQTVNGSKAAKRTEAAQDTQGQVELTLDAAKAAPTTARSLSDEKLDLSETARRSMSDPTFDRAKVEAIKAALKEGTYPLDSRRMAESFVALERLIQN